MTPASRSSEAASLVPAAAPRRALATEAEPRPVACPAAFDASAAWRLAAPVVWAEPVDRPSSLSATLAHATAVVAPLDDPARLLIADSRPFVRADATAAAVIGTERRRKLAELVRAADSAASNIDRLSEPALVVEPPEAAFRLIAWIRLAALDA
jgi:hypothetical protein